MCQIHQICVIKYQTLGEIVGWGEGEGEGDGESEGEGEGEDL